MAKINEYQFANKDKNANCIISDFCQNKDGTRMALAIASEIRIVAFDGKKWVTEHTLREHMLTVSGVDWDHVHDRIVSVSHDRNAYVWNYSKDDAKWKPALVVAGCMKGAHCVRWSPKGNKFAIGAADKSLAVCYHDGDNDMWVPNKNKQPKEGGKDPRTITSSVTCLDWSHNNMHIVCGTTSCQVLVFMCFVKECEGKPKKGTDVDKMKLTKPFTVGFEGFTMGPVTDVAFVIPNDTSSDACFLACDAAACIYYFDTSTENDSKKPVWKFPTPSLAYTTLEVLSDSSFCVAGFGCEPVVYKYDNKACAVSKELDPKVAKKKESKTNTQKARSMFEQKATLGKAGAASAGLKTKHQNIITSVRITGKRKNEGKKGLDAESQIGTAGVDGKIVTWGI